MRADNDTPRRPPPFVVEAEDGGSTIRVSLPGDAASVRTALVRISASMVAGGATEDAAGTVELVLAEVLNNVVEHAFQGRPAGRISVGLRISEAGVACEISDDGATMPGGMLPPGLAPPTDAPVEELPEGGFGWFLIQSLATELAYTRIPGGNLLTFEIPVEAMTPQN